LVLKPNSDGPLITQIEDYYSKVRNSTHCHALDSVRLSQLKMVKGIPRGEKPVVDSKKIDEQIKSIFGIKPQITLPKKAFIMTLAKNDIDGKRGEPYFLIPVLAKEKNKVFWGWPLPEPANLKHPSRKIQAKITVTDGQDTITENRRIYYFGKRQEFRFVSPKIYNLGMSFQGAFVMMVHHIHHGEHEYEIEIVGKQDKRFAELLKQATNVASHQKVWGYIK
jgi:hypothetical protein